MPIITRRNNPTLPEALPQSWNDIIKRYAPLLQAPPVRAGNLALTIFLLYAFFTNVLLDNLTLTTIGITVTFGTLGLFAIVILLLFLL